MKEQWTKEFDWAYLQMEKTSKGLGIIETSKLL